MISVGSRDGMMGLGFGEEMKMEETELEEGEACYDDENFDPDVRFSYIDEKIQDILGHFQKDFEGGVSAENLGSKFGGYGSFLPTYQRSPTIISHPRTPQKVQNYGSPNNWPSKDSCQNAKVPSTVAAMRPGSASVNSLTPVSIAPAVGNSSKRDLGLSSTQCTGEFTPKHKPVNKLSNPTDQKPPLKVRIKVGPPTIAAQNNAAIYSGLGLDISPSSSLEDSPSESEGLSPESRDALYASPMCILQNMTSFPVPEGFLLSPLSDHLLHLREQEKLPSDSRSGVSHKCSQDMMVSKKVSGQKKKKSLEKKLMEVKKKNVNDVGNKSTLLRKEINVKNQGDMELAPNTLKFPLASKSSRNNNDQARGTGSGSDVTREVDKCMLKEEIFSSFAKVEALESSTVHEGNGFEKQTSKTNLANSFVGDRKTSSFKDIQFEPRSEMRSKDDQGYDSYCDNKGRKYHNDGPNNCPEHKAGNKATYQEQYGSELPHGKEQLPTGVKKKSKGARGKDIPPLTEFPKESSRVVSSSLRKDKKKHAGNIPSKSKMEERRLQKESDKNSESNIDLFGNEKMELAENRMDLLETPFRHAPKDSKFNVTEKEITTFSDKSKGKNVENQVHAKVTPIITSSTGYGPVSDAVLETAAPLVIQDNWVCCDKCQKWRLLPYDHNPDKLPKKWLCSMICWLPGMNRCNISEEETTKAFHALYQVRVPESQNSLNTVPHGASTGVTLAGLQNVDQTHRDGDLHGVISGGRKKLKLKEAEYAAMHGHMDPTQFPESTTEGLQAMKSKSLHEASHMPLESNLASVAGFQHLSKSSDIPVDKLVHKLKEKKRNLQNGDDTRHPKMRIKRGIDQNGFSISKKIKKAVLDTDEEWFSDHHPVMGNRNQSSINWFKNKTTGKDVQNHSEYSQDSQYERKDKIPASAKKLPDNAKVSLNVVPLDPVICDKVVIAAKKRKLKDWQESNGHRLENSNISLKDETCESDRRKEKKARLSKSEKKESSSSKSGNKADKRGRVAPIIISTIRNPVLHGVGDNASDCIMKDQQLGHRQQGNKLLQQSLDATDIVKKDFDYAQPSVAAASSSSKVSGSRKSKVNFHDVKSSPVESVSSSPLRISKPDKVMPARRKLLGKDDVSNVGFDIMVSPRRAYCEVDGSNVPHETIRMKKASSLVHRSSGVSSALDKKDRDASGDKAKLQMGTFSSIFDNSSLVNGIANDCDQLNPCFGGEAVPPEGLDNRKSSNGAQQRKSGKGSSLRSKDKHRSSKSVYGNDDLKVSSSLSEQELYQTKNLRHEAEIASHDRSSHCEELKEEKNHFQEKCGAKSKRDEKTRLGKKDSLGKSLSESRKENQLNFGKPDCPDINIGGTSGKDRKSSPQKTPLQVYESDKLSNRLFSNATDLEIAPGKGKSQLYPNSGVKQEINNHSNRPKSGMLKASGSDDLPVGASGCSGDVCKASNQSETLDNQNGTRHNTSRHSISNGIVARDLGAPSPVRKDISSQAAANAFKEAKDLKHTADRMKNNGLEVESASIYFQAALKFLQGASILELCNSESAKHGEISYMIEMYSSTAKLCEFVAREYERLKDMASASLAYKCMEVAYMRIIYSRNSVVSKDRHELQAALQILPPGESPSSSASDLDNLNNQGTLDKVALAKGVSSPQMTGNHVIVARSHPNFVRLLNFAQNVNFAMEALRKSQNAFAAANADLGETRNSEGISSVKRVIDFTFYDVDGLLRLVRLAMEAISR